MTYLASPLSVVSASALTAWQSASCGTMHAPLPAATVAIASAYMQGGGEIVAAAQRLSSVLCRFFSQNASRNDNDVEGFVRRAYDFMCAGRKQVFTSAYVPLSDSFNRLAEGDAEPLGDCYDLSMILYVLAAGAGLTVNFYLDIYHAFVSVKSGADSELAIDAAYGPLRLVSDEYRSGPDGIKHHESGRICRRLGETDVFAIFLNRFGFSLEHDRDLSHAVFRRVIEISPRLAEGYNNLGDIMFSRKRYDEALRLYQEAVELEKWNIFFRINALLVKIIINPKMEKGSALLELDQILAIYPQFIEGHYLKYLLTGYKSYLATGEIALAAERTGNLTTYCRRVKPKLVLVARLLGRDSPALIAELGNSAAFQEFVSKLRAASDKGLDQLAHAVAALLPDTTLNDAARRIIMHQEFVASAPEGIIFFYRPWHLPYGAFSNFSNHGFSLDGLWWPTAEHYFQAHRFKVGSPNFHAVRTAQTPGETKILVRTLTEDLVEDFALIRDDVMRRAVAAKFASHPELTQLLVQTGTAHLVEHTWTDFYWGCGQDGSGKNRLGQILEEVRASLQK